MASFLVSCGRNALRRGMKIGTLRPISSQALLPSSPLSRQGASESTSRFTVGGSAFMSASAVAVVTATSSVMANGEPIVPLASCEEQEVFPDESLIYDTYNGVIVRAEKGLSMTAESFELALTQSLETWKLEGKRGIWIHLSTERADLVPICAKHGFDYHSAKNGALIMTKWLPTDSESRLPLGPSHQVGVGTIVLHHEDPNKLLVVQEKTGPAADLNLWKMPTGLLDPAEDIGAGAARELKEETGLDATLDRILVFRQAHHGPRGSDLFFVCLMQLQNPNQAVTLQEEEILDYKWMDMAEFMNQDLWQRSPLYTKMHSTLLQTLSERGEENNNTSNTGNNSGGGMKEVTLDLGYRRGTNALYIPAASTRTTTNETRK